MARRKFDLGWMRIFTETVRLGSLSRAAGSLGLTQPAVSYQIRRIEEQAGFAILHRNRQGVELTPKGRKLYEIAERTVGEVDMLVQEETGHPAVRLRTDYAFSSLWLIQRIDAFRSLHPQIDIQIVATQRFDPQELEDRDIAIVFGEAGEFESRASILVPEEVVPICSRDYLERNVRLADRLGLTSARLIHLDAPVPSPWFDWDHYLAGLGMKRDPSGRRGDLSFNTYSLVIQAAIANQGVALGWMGLVDDLLRLDLLVPAGPALRAPNRGYWLLPPRTPDASAARLVAWLTEETRAGH